MASARNNSELSQPIGAPATTPEARENQLISLAFDRVEKRIREGTASSQELVYFMKLASEKEQLEKEHLRKKNRYLEAQIESAGSAQAQAELLEKAVAAFSRYQGRDDVSDGDFED